MKNKLSNSSGLSLLEIILSVTLFSLLAGLIIYILSVSSGSWLKVRETAEIREGAQVVISRIEKELRASSIQSAEVIEYPSESQNNAISFLSAYDENGMVSFNSSGEINWQNFIIFYVTG